MGDSLYHYQGMQFVLLIAYRSHWYYQGQLKHDKILRKLEKMLVTMQYELKSLQRLVDSDKNAETRNGIVMVFIALINFWVEATVFLRTRPHGKYWRLVLVELLN